MTVACPEKLPGVCVCVVGGGGGGGGGAQSNLPTRDHQNIFNSILIYVWTTPYIHTHIHTYIHTYIHTFIHTYTHT